MYDCPFMFDSLEIGECENQKMLQAKFLILETSVYGRAGGSGTELWDPFLNCFLCNLVIWFSGSLTVSELYKCIDKYIYNL